MPWLEYNLHIRNSYFNVQKDYPQVVDALLDFVNPFITRNSHLYENWHYLFEVDQCREKQIEIRLRFESMSTNINILKGNLVDDLVSYVNRTNILMKDSETLGSHEGCHGDRGDEFLGATSDKFGADWPTIVEILQIGSESAIKILELGRSLSALKSLEWGARNGTYHPFYLHLSANQLYIEP